MNFVRLTVVKSDGSRYLHCTTAGEEIKHIKLDLLACDCAYLLEMIKAGDVLNAIDYSESSDNVLKALYIIYDPDILVNITQIASCFETYGIDARIALVKRLMEAPMGDAINLGNFASQLLDECIHRRETSKPYAESVSQFFHRNALAIAVGGVNNDFHTRARTQAVNISSAVEILLPNASSSFDRSEVILEPTFLSNILGIQGRMDLLQLDMSLVAEQKSGKGAWPDPSPGCARPVLAHQVQLLLYMAVIRYNFEDVFKANKGDLKAYLLYTKYTNPLVPEAFDGNLLAEALRVRNMLLWYEKRIEDGDDSFLFDLRPEDLCQHAPNRFWDNYVRPKLEATLQKLHTSDVLASKYYRRWMRFIAREHRLSRGGNKNKPCSGLASLWQCSLAEKLENGTIYASLSLASPSPQHENEVEELVLSFSPETIGSETANFRLGDVVLVYNYPPDTEPQPCNSMVFRGIIQDIGKESVTVRLRYPQSSVKPFYKFPERVWALEHDFIDSSFSSLYQGLHSFLDAPRDVRDLILFRRIPLTDKTRQLNLDHGSFNELSGKVLQAKDLFLIVGPPGTGKTSYGMLNTVKEELSHEQTSVLLLSFTNRAVDEICSKLAESGIDFLRIGPSLSCAPEYRHYLLSEIVHQCSNTNELRDFLTKARVVVGTCSAINSAVKLLGMRAFSLAIVDEASQITEPQLLGILSARLADGTSSIKKLVMIGDHKQLPAVVQQEHEQSIVVDEDLNNAGLVDCRMSLFERLLQRYGNNPDVAYMLTCQGRMHRKISHFPSLYFYGGKLKEVPLQHQTKALPAFDGMEEYSSILRSKRIAFFNVVERSTANVSDKVNYNEAKAMAQMARAIYEREGAEYTSELIGIIVPYRNQIACVRNAIHNAGVPDADMISIDTVERFQGSQRKYILYGFTIKQDYQLSFLTEHTFEEDDALIDRKLNVAMTRAREHLFMFGNAPLLKSSAVFNTLIEYCKIHNSFFDLKS